MDIMITTADEGNIDRTEYEEKVVNFLDDDTYRKLTGNSTQHIQKVIRPHNSRIPKFYDLPKIHKNIKYESCVLWSS